VVAIGGLKAKVQSAKLLKTGATVNFEQDEFSARFRGLPKSAPDEPVTVIEVACDSEPSINHGSIRAEWPRYGVGVR
jgi:alpha-L-fucosidase